MVDTGAPWCIFEPRLGKFIRESFDHEGMVRDPNLAFPIDRVRELAAAGRIGEVNHRHLSFMGSITAPGRLVRDHAPEAARLLREDGVDVALLVPV
jgi:D-proline reductase (dithiol) PrdB